MGEHRRLLELRTCLMQTPYIDTLQPRHSMKFARMHVETAACKLVHSAFPAGWLAVALSMSLGRT